jgi:hypothetical protein
MEANKGMMHSVIARQFKEAKPDVHPMHMIMSVMGMTIVPFYRSRCISAYVWSGGHGI